MEKMRVMKTGPWTFDKSLIVMLHLKENDQIGDLVFENEAFWIQVHNVPVNCMTSRWLKSWENQ